MYYGYERAGQIRVEVTNLKQEITTCEKQGNVSEAKALKDYRNYLFSVYKNVCGENSKQRVKRYKNFD